MPHPHSVAIDQHPNDVEPVTLAWAPVTADPGYCRAGEFSLFAPVHCLDRITEVCAVPCFDLDERDEPAPLDDEIDVTAAGLVPMLEQAPPGTPQPPSGESLSQNAETEPLACHAAR